MSESLDNQIYSLAQKINSTNDQNEKITHLNKLGKIIYNCFEKQNAEPISKAILKAASLNDNDAIETLMHETYLEIENIAAQDESGNEINSSFLLMPIIVQSEKHLVTTPSINEIQEVIRKNLIENKIITRNENFNIGTARITKDNAQDLNIQEWYDTHKSLLENDETSTQNKTKRDKKIEIQLDGQGNGTYFFLPILTFSYDENDEVVENIIDNSNNVDLWNNISNEISTEDTAITIMGPHFINFCLTNIDFTFQTIEIDKIFEFYNSDDTIEVAYSKIENKEDSYIVIFYGIEEHEIQSYYLFETTGYNFDFISYLVEKCIRFDKTLISINPEVSESLVDEWAAADDVIIKDLINTSHHIDLKHTNNLINISNPSFESPTNTTIH